MSNIQGMEGTINSIEDEHHPTLDKLPTEVILHLLGSMLPREVMTLAKVSIRLRSLSIWKLHHSYGLQLSENPWLKDITMEHSITRDYINEERTPSIENNDVSAPQRMSPPMSDFELYARLVLLDFYTDEMVLYGEADSKPVVMTALSYAKKLLRRLYQHDPANAPLSHDLAARGLALMSTSTQALLLNPYTTASENTHVLARVIADQVCQGACYPESAVLLLQCLCSLHDQNQFQFMVNSQERDISLRLPSGEERVTIGQLCFQYLVPVILALLKPSSQPGQTPAISADLCQGQQTQPLLSFRSSPSGRSPSNDSKSLTVNTLPEQLVLISPSRIRSVQHLTKILCFLPLLGRHFNTLPTSTFIETFLDRSKGYIPIDKAAVLVYGFMCVLDLETGKANLASDSYRIFERSMPTQGVVQAKEMVRTVERHRALMRGFLLSSPTFSSSRIFR
ncbi:hypothetical protein BG006_008065 [Podila minutissima]|uniref:F-box domain-containing protein n=1 Tax=Podila minutissima TaxID=64525 RepID=A0A9P5SR80_9FUNG|nr:hypothetical protein BG006_008065 [Podila minutissima]